MKQSFARSYTEEHTGADDTAGVAGKQVSLYFFLHLKFTWKLANCSDYLIVSWSLRKIFFVISARLLYLLG